jgi:branched-chain amino acid transport system permease protein
LAVPAPADPNAPVALPNGGPDARWRRAEWAFWLLPVAAYFVFPESLVLLSQIAITGLFCLSLDLILGYAGIVSLGHAAFFGVGAYAAGLLASHGHGDPLLGLAVAAAGAGALGYASSFLVLRGSDLTRLMVTLGVAMMLYEAANKLTDLTGGVDGLSGMEVQPLLGRFAFDLYGKTAYVYSVAVLFLLFCLARRLVHSPFGLSLRGIHLNVGRMPALGTPVNRRLSAIYTIGAAYAGVAGALMAQTTQFVAVDSLAFSRSAELLRRAARADRTERRRQDHRDQSAHRRAQPTAGSIMLDGRDITALARTSACGSAWRAPSRSTSCSSISRRSRRSGSRSPSGSARARLVAAGRQQRRR